MRTNPEAAIIPLLALCLISPYVTEPARAVAVKVQLHNGHELTSPNNFGISDGPLVANVGTSQTTINLDRVAWDRYRD